MCVHTNGINMQIGLPLYTHKRIYIDYFAVVIRFRTRFILFLSLFLLDNMPKSIHKLHSFFVVFSWSVWLCVTFNNVQIWSAHLICLDNLYIYFLVVTNDTLSIWLRVNSKLRKRFVKISLFVVFATYFEIHRSAEKKVQLKISIYHLLFHISRDEKGGEWNSISYF